MYSPSQIEQQKEESRAKSCVPSRELKELHEALCKRNYEFNLERKQDLYLLYTILAGANFDVEQAIKNITQCK